MPYPVDRLTVEANAMVGYAPTDCEERRRRRHRRPAAARRRRRARGTNGGEEVRGYLPSMGQIFLRRFQMVSQFRQALETGQVSVHYQPKITLPNRTVFGVEALVRWAHPEFGKLGPDEFVPAIEAAGLIGALTDFVHRTRRCRSVREWLDRGLRISAAVNLSVRNLADEEFPDRVSAALDALRHPAGAAHVRADRVRRDGRPAERAAGAARLHSLGITLAVDDFGTGYSSLAYLRQLPVDEVKIDKSFVLGMGTDLGDLAVVRSIVELGHSLGLTVVAEGVEDDAARDQLAGDGLRRRPGLPDLAAAAGGPAGGVAAGPDRRSRQGMRDETVLTL